MRISTNHQKKGQIVSTAVAPKIYRDKCNDVSVKKSKTKAGQITEYYCQGATVKSVVFKCIGGKLCGSSTSCAEDSPDKSTSFAPTPNVTNSSSASVPSSAQTSNPTPVPTPTPTTQPFSIVYSSPTPENGTSITSTFVTLNISESSGGLSQISNVTYALFKNGLKLPERTVTSAPFSGVFEISKGSYYFTVAARDKNNRYYYLGGKSFSKP